MSTPSTTTANRELIDAVSTEVCSGIDRAVGFWMKQIEDVLQDSRLTTLGRLQAVKEVVSAYRHRYAAELVESHGNAA
jgi:hypothetical protein